MIYLKIHQSTYYSKKKDFVKIYKKFRLTWEEFKDIDGELSNGWFFSDRIDEYVLKLPEEGEFKRFKIKGCQIMVDFLKSIGAVEFSEKGEEAGEKDIKVVENGVIKSGVVRGITQEERFGHFVGADLWNGYRVREILKDMPENWGVIWSEKQLKAKTN